MLELRTRVHVTGYIQLNVWEVMTVKSTQRHAAAAVGILALSLLGAPASGQTRPAEPPQRGGQPKQDTPYILIATFRSDDRLLGVLAADEVRKRVASEHSAQELFVVTKHNINTTLEASGYRADSALNASDLMELSKQLHGEYVLDAKVSKSGGTVHIEPQAHASHRQVTLTQPLPNVDGKDAGDAAKGVEKAITDALKGIPAYRLCVNDLRAQKYDAAVKDAQTGIAALSEFVAVALVLAAGLHGPQGATGLCDQRRQRDSGDRAGAA